MGLGFYKGMTSHVFNLGFERFGDGGCSDEMPGMCWTAPLRVSWLCMYKQQTRLSLILDCDETSSSILFDTP